MRICSLLPSATEIVAALRLADRLVFSAECDWPPEVRGLTVVTAARIDTSELGSLEIHRAVREAIADGRSLDAIDEELIDALGPDLILTQDLCEVCAVSSAEVSRLCKVDAEVVSLDPRTIAEIEESVLRLAGRLGVPERGAAVVAGMRARIARARELVAGFEPRRAFVAEWLDPPFAAGHWVPEMVELASGEEVWGGPARRHSRPPGRPCASARPSSSSSLPAASTPRGRRGRRSPSASLPGGRRRRQRLLLAPRPAGGRPRRPARLPPPFRGRARSGPALDRTRARYEVSQMSSRATRHPSSRSLALPKIECPSPTRIVSISG